MHVSTQMPYAIVAATCSFVGYLVAGFTMGNVWLTVLAAVVLLIVTLVVLHKMTQKKIDHLEEEEAHKA